MILNPEPIRNAVFTYAINKQAYKRAVDMIHP